MFRCKTVVLSLVMLLVLMQPGRADDRDLGNNAALKYWRAFALMPALTDAEQDRLREGALTVPLDDKIREVVAKHESALHELHHGAKIPHCDWSIDLIDGVSALLPELRASRALTTAGILRMRLAFEKGQKSDALDGALDLLKFGRDMSRGGTIVAVLVGVAIEHVTLDAVAANLPQVDAATLRSFAERFEKLAPMATVAEATLYGEKQGFLDWFVRKVHEECKDDESLIRFLGAMVGSEKEQNEAKLASNGKQVFAACGGSRAAVLKLAEQCGPFYATWARQMDLPLDEFNKKWERKVKEVFSANPLLKIMAPALDKCRVREAQREALLKLFKTALAIQLDGPNAVKNSRDPFGDGPFDYIPFEGGYELKSKLKAQDKSNVEKQVTLAVGRRKD